MFVLKNRKNEINITIQITLIDYAFPYSSLIFISNSLNK